MGAILEQLGLDQTFFVQLAIFAVLFFVLTRIYFRPFMKLFQVRHQRTVEDKEAAENLTLQAQAKLAEYQRQLAEESANARREYDAVLAQVKKEESALLGQAREEAKKITQGMAETVNVQRAELKKRLDADVESLAKAIADKLISRKG